MSEIPEHTTEPVPGLPAELPPGEQILWQGKPDFWGFAIRVFHVRKVALYFGLLWLLTLVAAPEFLARVDLIMLAMIGVAMLLGLSALLHRSTLYTITNRRVVMRFGVALPIALNLPFEQIQTADIKDYGKTGDLLLTVDNTQGTQPNYFVMWPHARPWHVFNVKPMLRCVPNAVQVAETLSEAWQLQRDHDAIRHSVVQSSAKGIQTTKGSAPEAPFPLPPLLGAGLLLTITLASVALFRVYAPPAEPISLDNAVASVLLRFEDTDQGSVRVLDATSGRLLDELASGSNNFLRATLRALVRDRNTRRKNDRSHFGLYRLPDGRLLLVDPVTDQHIDLLAFGKTNAQAFSKFLDSARLDTAGLQSMITRPNEAQERDQ